MAGGDSRRVVMGFDRQGKFPNFDAAVSAEYFLTSNSGAYSSSTICGANSRRYHAILAAALEKPKGTYVLLSSLEEVLCIGGARFYLSTVEYPGALFPEGYKHIVSFEMDPLPTFTYEVEGVRLKKTVAVGPHESTAVVAFELLTKQTDVKLALRPLCAFRDKHRLTDANPYADMTAKKQGEWTAFKPYPDLPALRMGWEGEFQAEAYWHKRLLYRRDSERGHSGQEDLMSPGAFSAGLKPGKPVYFVATIEDMVGAGAAIMKAAEATALEWAKASAKFPTIAAKLAPGLKDFVVERGQDAGAVRGLPWYNEWARHAMMSVPGLLAIGRYVEAQAVLATWARRGRNGILPTYIDDYGSIGGPDIEGTLWFFEAVENYLAYTKNHEWVKGNVASFMHEALSTIASGQSTAPGRLREDGLVYTSGESRAFAPRGGDNFAFVEIQGLYFNALKVMEGIATHFRDEEGARLYHATAKAHQKAFNELMWDAKNHVAYDCLSEGGPDPTPRPMALLSLSLTHPVLIRRRWELLVDQVENALLTPLGLLALPPEYPAAKKIFPGDSYDQARRYGGIWPQFLGQFLVAHVKTFGKSARHKELFEKYVKPLEEHLSRAMLDHLPEFFDSTPPFIPRGAPADAAACNQIVWALTTKVEPHHYGGEGEA